MMKIVGIIQARLGSTRLPNKMLLSLHGKPIIEWVVRRVQKSNLLDDIIVALPNSKENDLLEYYCKTFKVKTFRGQENDVLTRFYNAAKIIKATHIVRICADNPLICPEEIDNLIEFYRNNQCDYAYNHIPKENMYPDGLGAEIISFELLENINKIARKPYNREHVLTYITENHEQYVIKTFNPPNKKLHHPELKFDVDTFEDYLYLHSKSYDLTINCEQIISIFTKDKE